MRHLFLEVNTCKQFDPVEDCTEVLSAGPQQPLMLPSSWVILLGPLLDAMWILVFLFQLVGPALVLRELQGLLHMLLWSGPALVSARFSQHVLICKYSGKDTSKPSMEDSRAFSWCSSLLSVNFLLSGTLLWGSWWLCFPLILNSVFSTQEDWWFCQPVLPLLQPGHAL